MQAQLRRYLLPEGNAEPLVGFKGDSSMTTFTLWKNNFDSNVGDELEKCKVERKDNSNKR